MDGDGRPAKLALFLGAGACSFAGYRTFDSFPDLIFRPEARSDEGLNSVDARTLELLRNVGTVLDIEGLPRTHDNFMWILDNYTKLLKSLRIDNELKLRFVAKTVQESDFSVFDALVKNAISEMTTTTIRHYARNRVDAANAEDSRLYDDIKRAYELYACLALLNDQEKPFLPVFTTNYDPLLEDMFSEFADSSSYVFPLVNGFYDYSVEEAHWESRLYDHRSRASRGLYLYRLHGCVCWYWHEHGMPVYFHRHRPPQDAVERVCAMFPGREIYRGNDPHGPGFRALHHTLISCEAIAFIGFSFRDQDVAHVLLSANAQRQRLPGIIVVDPHLARGSLVERLHKAARNCQFPVRVPMPEEIIHLPIEFGVAEDFAERVLGETESLLSTLGENR